MFRSVMSAAILCVLLLGCAPKDEYDQQMTAIMCRVENNSFRLQYMMCVHALEGHKANNASNPDPSGSQAGRVQTAGPGGMVTQPGPGGMVTDPGAGLFPTSSYSPISQCVTTNAQIATALHDCEEVLQTCQGGGNCDHP